MAAEFFRDGTGQGNVGFSGTPLWKLKQQGVVKAKTDASEAEAVEREVMTSKVIMETCSYGGVEAPAKPLVRHVLVKDLRKVAARAKLALPRTGLFEKGAPVSLFVLLDGQSCADEASCGPNAAEWCAKNVHTRLIRNLAGLSADQVNKTFLEATLIKTFEDLDNDLLVNNPGIQDGCGAAMALLVGETLFTAVLGKCDAMLCSRSPHISWDSGAGDAFKAQSFGTKQGRCSLPDEQKWLQQHGGTIVEIGGVVSVRDERTGAICGVSRSLGDRAFKIGPDGLIGVLGAATLVRCEPTVTTTFLSLSEDSSQHPYLVLLSNPVVESSSTDSVASVMGDFPLKPRACCSEIACRAAEARCPTKPCSSPQQCSAVTVLIRPPEKEALQDNAAPEPVLKKPKKDDLQSIRLRHVLVRHRDCPQPFDPVRSKPVVRRPQEAEIILRQALRELQKDSLDAAAKAQASKDKKKIAAAHLAASPKYLKLCKEFSECESASKGGNMCGDLGWQGATGLRGFGVLFEQAATGLSIGDWSDIVPSEKGLHIVQRIA